MTESASKRTGPWIGIALFIGALLPRLAAIGRYITPDELTWVYRSVQFREALLAGRWADTLITGHPGVTTTWLGTLGISAQLLLRPADRAIYDWITYLAWLAPDNIPAFPKLASLLTGGRLAVILITCLGVAAIFRLARPLFGQRAALLGASLLALDPFAGGLSGLFHVDGLLATLSTLSLLALINAIQLGRPDPTGRSAKAYLLASLAGLCATLALLTKSPALLLLPFSGLIFLTALVNRAGLGWRSLLLMSVSWAFALVLTAAVVWPAVWSSPVEVIETVRGIAGQHVETALRPTFFLGEVALDHGPLFYPVALAFRLGPVALIGSILGLTLLVRKRLNSAGAWLALWSLAYAAAITVAAKKFDRYLLPVLPPLMLLAGAAWSQVRLPGPSHRDRLLATGLIGGQLILLLVAFPYPLAAYNPLLGGGPVAAKALPVGWGESIGLAGRWLAQQPLAAESSTLVGLAPSLAPFYPGETILFGRDGNPPADYVILSLYDKQVNPSGFASITLEAELLETIHFGGLDQAWIYKMQDGTRDSGRHDSVMVPAGPFTFGDRVQLLGVGARASDSIVKLSLQWQLLQPGGRYAVQLTLRDAWGHTWAHLETPLLNDVYFFPEHWLPRETPTVGYTLKLPPGLPAADYTMELELYDTTTGSRLPGYRDGAFQGVVYSYGPISVPLPEEPIPAGLLQVPQPLEVRWLGGGIQLVGLSQPPAEIVAGDSMILALYWQTWTALPGDLTLSLDLGEATSITTPFSRSQWTTWRPGESIMEQYSVPIPPELPAGRYPLTIRLLTDDDPTAGEAVVLLTEVTVQSTDRSFTLPADIPVPLDFHLEDNIWLRGFALDPADLLAGESAKLTLYWQAEAQPAGAYTTFVHLVAWDGSNVTQSDHWPGDSLSNTWAPGQVILDEHWLDIPDEIPAGEYPLAVGLYTAASGDRLLIRDAAGQPVPDDRLMLPVQLRVLEQHE